MKMRRIAFYIHDKRGFLSNPRARISPNPQIHHPPKKCMGKIMHEWEIDRLCTNHSMKNLFPIYVARKLNILTLISLQHQGQSNSSYLYHKSLILTGLVLPTEPCGIFPIFVLWGRGWAKVSHLIHCISPTLNAIFTTDIYVTRVNEFVMATHLWRRMNNISFHINHVLQRFARFALSIHLVIN